MVDPDNTSPMLTSKQREDVVVTALVTVTGCEAMAIEDATPLSDLGVDSLMLTSLVLEVEDLLGFELPLDVLADLVYGENLEVVGDVTRLLARVTGPAV